MTKFKVRVSFFSASGFPFNQGELVDPETYHNQTATDKGNFDQIEMPDTNAAPATSPAATSERLPFAAKAAQLASVDPNVPGLWEKSVPQPDEANAMAPAEQETATNAPQDTTAPALPASYPPNAPVTHAQLAVAHESFLKRLDDALKSMEEKIAVRFKAVVESVEEFLKPPADKVPQEPVPAPPAPSEGDNPGTTP